MFPFCAIHFNQDICAPLLWIFLLTTVAWESLAEIYSVLVLDRSFVRLLVGCCCCCCHSQTLLIEISLLFLLMLLNRICATWAETQRKSVICLCQWCVMWMKLCCHHTMNRIRSTSNEKGNEQNCAQNLMKIVCICLEYWNLESIQSPDNLSHFFAATRAMFADLDWTPSRLKQQITFMICWYEVIVQYAFAAQLKIVRQFCHCLCCSVGRFNKKKRATKIAIFIYPLCIVQVYTLGVSMSIFIESRHKSSGKFQPILINNEKKSTI